MARIAASLLIWVLFIGITGYYVWNQNSATASSNDQAVNLIPVIVEDKYSLHITTTFDAEPDPFALQLDESISNIVLSVKRSSTVLHQVTDTLKAGQAVVVSELPKMQVGSNEFLIEANPPQDKIDSRHAVLVELFKNGVLVQDDTFWSAPGVNVAGLFKVEIEQQNEKDDHGH